MIGFKSHPYTILDFTWNDAGDFTVIGKESSAGLVGLRANSFELFKITEDGKAVSYGKPAEDSQRIERWLHFVDPNLPYRSAVLYYRNGIFGSETEIFRFDDRPRAMFDIGGVALIAEDAILLQDPTDIARNLVRHRDGRVDRLSRLDKTLVISNDRTQFDRLEGASALAEMRLSALNNALSEFERFLPFYVGAGKVEQLRVGTTDICHVRTLSELQTAVGRIIRRGEDVLWNTTLAPVDFSGYLVSLPQTAQRIFLDIDTEFSNFDMIISDFETTCQHAVQSVVRSSSGGAHLIFEPFTHPIDAASYRKIVSLCQLHGFRRNLLHVDQVSRNCQHFYFLPYVPALKKGLRVSEIVR